MQASKYSPLGILGCLPLLVLSQARAKKPITARLMGTNGKGKALD